MAQYDYDLFTIGAGSGGVSASRVAAAHGAKVAVAEEHRVGGTCVIRGCVPKKMLVYGAHFAEDLQDAKAFGWNVENPTFDWKVLRDSGFAHVRAEARNRLYSLDTAPLVQVEEWLDPFRRFWDHKLEALATEVARGKKARRETYGDG